MIATIVTARLLVPLHSFCQLTIWTQPLVYWRPSGLTPLYPRRITLNRLTCDTDIRNMKHLSLKDALLPQPPSFVKKQLYEVHEVLGTGTFGKVMVSCAMPPMHIVRVGWVMGDVALGLLLPIIDFFLFLLLCLIESNLACPSRPDRRSPAGCICIFQPEPN